MRMSETWCVPIHQLQLGQHLLYHHHHQSHHHQGNHHQACKRRHPNLRKGKKGSNPLQLSISLSLFTQTGFSKSHYIYKRFTLYFGLFLSLSLSLFLFLPVSSVCKRISQLFVKPVSLPSSLYTHNAHTCQLLQTLPLLLGNRNLTWIKFIIQPWALLLCKLSQELITGQANTVNRSLIYSQLLTSYLLLDLPRSAEELFSVLYGTACN